VCPQRHGVTRPRVADGGNGVQIWRVAANILNKQLLTAEVVVSCRFGVPGKEPPGTHWIGGWVGPRAVL
jgi:hypothetical protein